MHRRVTLLVAFAVQAVLSVGTHAQQPARVQRIGFLGPSSPRLVDELRTALAALGQVEGRTFVVESRWPEADRLDQLPEAAAALVGLKVDVLFAVGATAARAAKGVTTNIPIVFVAVVDPVASGLVADWGRPGGNVTGVTSFDPQQASRQLGILRAAIPSIARIALLGDTAADPAVFRANEDAARALGLQVLALKVDRVRPDFEGALEAAARGGAGAVVILSTPVTTPHRRRIAELAVGHRLPTLSPRDHADAGALISYGTSFSEVTRRAAAHVDAILKGATPGDLPIGTAEQQELVINLRTALELGITVPAAVLRDASQVIE